MTKKENALATIDESQYPALTSGAAQMEVIRGNMGGEDIAPEDLTTIRVPLGGATTWEIPTAEGVEPAAALEGILVHITSRRAFWASNDSDGPPDCSSKDCRVGKGNPGGDCLLCPKSEFGSATNEDGSPGKGQACSKHKLLFLLRPGQLLPDVVSAPPTSLKALHCWQLQLGVPYYSFVTRLTLEKHEEGKKKWSTIVPAKGEALGPDAVRQILEYSKTLQTLFATVVMSTNENEENFTPQEM